MRVLASFLGLLVLGLITYVLSNRPENQPNIILIFTDDWGYADLEAHGVLGDIKTPHLNELARQGILFSNAYVTSPQCSPSRAGLLTGRYQQRFGLDSIPDTPLPVEETTLANHLQTAGYTTGMVGKWHLEPNSLSKKWASKHHPELVKNGRVQVTSQAILPYLPQNRGFEDYYLGVTNIYWTNHALYNKNAVKSGRETNIYWTNPALYNKNAVKSGRESEYTGSKYRLDVQTDASLSFISRHSDEPFFLYLAYFAPHVPLEAPQKYLQRFPGEMPERRRTALAMMSAVDEGVGRIVDLLKEKGIYERTLIIFTSDNGAPLGAHQQAVMADILPVNKQGAAWDGSRNDPLTGEKGMLSEGGIRVPMIWAWPDALPRNMVIDEPVISLDITASVLAAAQTEIDSSLDGENLLPFLQGTTAFNEQRPLFWRFWSQAAVRTGDWKLIYTGDRREMLFNLVEDPQEKFNEIGNFPEIAGRLKLQLEAWASELEPAGLADRPLNRQEQEWYRYYFPAGSPVSMVNSRLQHPSKAPFHLDYEY
jgi:arylsulfatase A-like enzyme